VLIKSSRKKEEDQITPEGIVNELISNIQSGIQYGSSILQDFIREYHKQFIKLPDWKFTAAGRIERDILDLFKAPLIMYALKLNGQVIVEIYGILERYAVLALVNLFDSDSDRKSTIEQLAQRWSLVDLAEILITLKLWDKEDIEFAKGLREIRNATAYKNPKKIADKVTPGRNISLLDINKVLSNHPVLPDLFNPIRLLFKLNDRYLYATDRGKEAKRLLESK
jgi:hypothetical protein